MVQKTESSELQPGGTVAAFTIFNPKLPPFLAQIAILMPQRPIWSAFDSDQLADPKVDYLNLEP